MSHKSNVTFIMIQLFLFFLIINVSECSISKKWKKKLNRIRILEEATSSMDEEATSDTSSTGNQTIYNNEGKSSGLSTGAICAIAIPSIAALLGVAAAATLLKGGAVATPALAPAYGSSLPPPNYVNTSLENFNVPQQPIIQPEPEIIQPVQTVQPVQQVPQYPLPKHKVKMVPVQQVEMVPVQQVEMVPVQEIVPVQEMVQVQGVVPQAVQVHQVPQFVQPGIQQVVPMQNVFPVQQGVESIPQITQVSDIQGITQAQQLGGELFSQPQVIQSDVQQIGSNIIQGNEFSI